MNCCSPGVLETGYETFASAAFKRGFVSPNGESQMKVGSPPDTGWMDFIPNLLARKDRQQPNQLLGSSETDALLPSNPSLSQSLTISPSCEAVDDPDQVIRNDQVSPKARMKENIEFLQRLPSQIDIHILQTRFRQTELAAHPRTIFRPVRLGNGHRRLRCWKLIQSKRAQVYHPKRS